MIGKPLIVIAAAALMTTVILLAIPENQKKIVIVNAYDPCGRILVGPVVTNGLKDFVSVPSCKARPEKLELKASDGIVTQTGAASWKIETKRTTSQVQLTIQSDGTLPNWKGRQTINITNNWTNALVQLEAM